MAAPADKPPIPYTTGAILLHWLIAALLFSQIAFGWFLETIPRGSALRGPTVNLHKSTGLLLGILILLRLLWRLRHPAPPLPSFMPTWERRAARWSHRLLYTCMLLMPLSGYVASNFSKFGVKLFNSLWLPPWGFHRGANDPLIYSIFNTTHIVTSYLFVILIVVHVFAAVTHLIRRDAVFFRMLPSPRPQHDHRSTTG
jgi:cytochrome b561